MTWLPVGEIYEDAVEAIGVGHREVHVAVDVDVTDGDAVGGAFRVAEALFLVFQPLPPLRKIAFLLPTLPTTMSKSPCRSRSTARTA